MEIAGRAIGSDQPMYIVAELSANHGQDLDVALQLIREAARAGADAVKLQTYTPDTITIDSDRPEFFIDPPSPWAGQRLYELYQQAYTPWEWYPTLRAEAERQSLAIFSSPFDTTAVDFLEDQGVPAYKIASFEVIDHGLVARVAATGKPLILSTGMATLAEIAAAVEVARDQGARDLVVLRCNSGYPAKPDEMDLASIHALAAALDTPVGLSDHTTGPEAAVVARSLGACMLEKHIEPGNGNGLDAEFSASPSLFAETVAAVRRAERMLGRVRFGPTPREQHALAHRRSLYVIRDMQAGDAFTTTNVRSIRPNAGLAPWHLPLVLSRRVTRDIPAGTPLDWAMVGDQSSGRDDGQPAPNFDEPQDA